MHNQIPRHSAGNNISKYGTLRARVSVVVRYFLCTSIGSRKHDSHASSFHSESGQENQNVKEMDRYSHCAPRVAKSSVGF